MWYTVTGTDPIATEHEKELFSRLAFLLSKEGWQARTGGRGALDDLFHKASLEGGGAVKVFVPFGFYRHYNVKQSNHVVDFSQLPEPIQEKSLALCEGGSAQCRIRSPLHRNLMASTVTMLLGETLDEPSRFVLTYKKRVNSNSPMGSGLEQSGDLLGNTQEAPLFHLARNREIPVFNLANDEHQARIRAFVEKNSNQEKHSALS